MTISNTDNTIDSRDVIARIEELEAKREDLRSAMDDHNTDSDAYEEANAALKEFDNSEEGQELTTLKALAEQGEDYALDWKYGARLIHEDYFEKAMGEMVADRYARLKDLPSWMTITYDYDVLKQDYTELDFDGVTFLVRYKEF